MNKELLYKFFEGTASVEQGMKVKAWMEASAENEQAFYKERKTFDAIILNSYQSGAGQQRRAASLFKKIIAAPWFRMAGVIVLTLLVSHLYEQYQAGYIIEKMNTISVPAGQRVNVILPDGTDVWLNARTTLQYSSAFGHRQRTVILNGEAYFDVSENKNKPFVVQTKLYNIEVLGTKFNVNAYSGQGDFETALMQGHVKVTSQANPAQNVHLLPEQKAYLKDGKLHLAAIRNHEPYRWKEGLICFKGATFRDMMRDFEKYYGVKIEIHNKNVLKYYFTGKFRQSDGIDYALRVLQNDIRFTFEKDTEKQIIYIR